MVGMQPRKKRDGTWTYPSSEEVLEKAGLYMVSYYIEVRRQTILNFIVDRPIFHLQGCSEAAWHQRPPVLVGATDGSRGSEKFASRPGCGVCRGALGGGNSG